MVKRGRGRVFPGLKIFERFANSLCRIGRFFFKFFDYTQFEFSVCYFKIRLRYMQASVLHTGILHEQD